MRRRDAFQLGSVMLWTAALGAPKYRKYYKKYCTEEQVAFEDQAWADALIIGDALGQWRPGGKGQAAVDMFMGTDSSKMMIWDRSWSEILRGNIQGALSVHSDGGLPPTQNLYIMCTEPDYFGSHCSDFEAGYGYTYTDKGIFYDDHYVVFCPRFYATDNLLTTLHKANDGTIDKTQVDPFMYSSGSMYYHESLHWMGLTSTYAYPVYDSPDGLAGGSPKMYGAGAAADGAKTYNTAGMVHVADAYCSAALAILVQDFFNLTYPPGPPGLSTRSIPFPPIRYFDGPHPWDNLTRPAELPDPNTPNNTAKSPVEILSRPFASASSIGSQPTNNPTQDPKKIVGTS